MNGKQRAEFENKFAEPWALENEVCKWKDSEGNYIYSQLDIAWQAWQAAISSVVVDIKNLKSASYTSSGVVYISDVADAIEKAGVKHNDE